LKNQPPAAWVAGAPAPPRRPPPRLLQGLDNPPPLTHTIRPQVPENGFFWRVDSRSGYFFLGPDLRRWVSGPSSPPRRNPTRRRPPPHGRAPYPPVPRAHLRRRRLPHLRRRPGPPPGPMGDWRFFGCTAKNHNDSNCGYLFTAGFASPFFWGTEEICSRKLKYGLGLK